MAGVGRAGRGDRRPPRPGLTVKKALLPLVMAGAAGALTVIVSASVAVLPEALVAEMRDRVGARPSRWPACRRWWPVPLPLSVK